MRNCDNEPSVAFLFSAFSIDERRIVSTNNGTESNDGKFFSFLLFYMIQSMNGKSMFLYLGRDK